MTMPKEFSEYSGFEFCGAFVRSRDIIAFTAQKWDVSDPLEQRDTGVFFYYPDDPPEDRWAFRYFGETTGVHACACFKPSERWVFVMDDGEVYVVGMGDDDWEQPVAKLRNPYF